MKRRDWDWLGKKDDEPTENNCGKERQIRQNTVLRKTAMDLGKELEMSMGER